MNRRFAVTAQAIGGAASYVSAEARENANSGRAGIAVTASAG